MHRESKNPAVAGAYKNQTYTDAAGTVWQCGFSGWYGRPPGEEENIVMEHPVMVALITQENPPERWEIYNTLNLLPVGLGTFHSEEAAAATVARFHGRDEKAGRPPKPLGVRPVIQIPEDRPEPKEKPLKSRRRPGFTKLSV